MVYKCSSAQECSRKNISQHFMGQFINYRWGWQPGGTQFLLGPSWGSQTFSHPSPWGGGWSNIFWKHFFNLPQAWEWSICNIEEHPNPSCNVGFRGKDQNFIFWQFLVKKRKLPLKRGGLSCWGGGEFVWLLLGRRDQMFLRPLLGSLITIHGYLPDPPMHN